jgi:hypothetical protein
MQPNKNQTIKTKVTDKPIKTIRAGRISAAIWANDKEIDGEMREFRNVSLTKNYKDKDSDEWKTTNSLNLNELPKAVTVLQKAYEFLILKDDAENTQDDTDY